eukprot:890999-Alexandrium_andersonii.AAC.1
MSGVVAARRQVTRVAVLALGAPNGSRVGFYVAVIREVTSPGLVVPGWALSVVVACLVARSRLGLHVAVLGQVPFPAQDVRGQIGDPGSAVPCGASSCRSAIAGCHVACTEHHSRVMVGSS